MSKFTIGLDKDCVAFESDSHIVRFRCPEPAIAVMLMITLCNNGLMSVVQEMTVETIHKEPSEDTN